MNDITQDEFEGVLTARAESLTVGSAPADAVLAGARRRGVRRRALVGVAGVLAVAGMGAEVAGFGGSGSGPASAGSGGQRRVPVVTQQVGLAPGQRPMSSERVIASGTVDGAPWQVAMTEKVGPAKNDPMFAAALVNQKDVGGGPLTCVHLALRVAGRLLGDSAGCGTQASPTVGEILPAFMIDGTKTQISYLAMVTDDVRKVVWSGKDGFRQEAVPSPTPFPGVKLAVFPDRVPPHAGDVVADYDSSGKTINSVDIPLAALPATPGRPS